MISPVALAVDRIIKGDFVIKSIDFLMRVADFFSAVAGIAILTVPV